MYRRHGSYCTAASLIKQMLTACRFSIYRCGIGNCGYVQMRESV